MILGSTAGGKAALPAIDVEDALHVGLRAGAGEDAARLELHLAFQRGLLDLAVALEGDLVDDRVLDHRDQDAGAFAIDAHVGEQAGGEQGLDGLVDLARIVGIADVELEVGANRLRLDAPVAGHANLADRGRSALQRAVADISTGSTSASANSAAIATRIKCQPPDLHIAMLGIRPVCLSVRRSLQSPYPSASGGRFASVLLQPEVRRGKEPLSP